MSLSAVDAVKLLVPTTRNGTHVYIRSPVDRQLMDAFDIWHVSCNWKPEKENNRKYGKLNWDSTKYSQSWEMFEQCAFVKDGYPQISCIVCLNLMQHPSINGNKTMNDHVEGAVHKKNIAKLKLKHKAPDGNIVDLLAKQGIRGTKVGDLPVNYALILIQHRLPCVSYRVIYH